MFWCLPAQSWLGGSVLPVAGCSLRMGPQRGSESSPSSRRSLWRSRASLPESSEVSGRVPRTVARVSEKGQGDHKRSSPHLFARRMHTRRSRACPSASWNPNHRKLGDLTIVCVRQISHPPPIRNSLLYCACVSSFLMQNLAWAFGYVMST